MSRLQLNWRGALGLPTPRAKVRRPSTARAPRQVATWKHVSPQDLVRPSSLGRKLNPQLDPCDAVKIGLKGSPWVYACVKRRMDSIATVPWRAEVRKADGTWEPAPAEHPLQQLVDKPNREQTWQVLMQNLSASLDVVGEGLLSKRRAPSAPGGPSATVSSSDPAKPGKAHGVFELWALPIGSLIPIPSTVGQEGAGLVAAYETRDTRVIVAGDDVIRPMYVDPSNAYHGLAPLVAAVRDVEVDGAAGEWQRSSFANRGIPDGILKINIQVEPESLADELAALRQAYFGAKAARAPMVLGEDVEWIPLASDPTDLDFIDGRKLARETICAAYRTPPVLVGILDKAAYGNGYHVALADYWTFSIVPTLTLIESILNLRLAPEFGPGVRLVYDTTGLDAQRMSLAERVVIAKDLHTLGYSADAISDRLALGMPSVEGITDQGVLSTTLAAAADILSSGMEDLL